MSSHSDHEARGTGGLPRLQPAGEAQRRQRRVDRLPRCLLLRTSRRVHVIVLSGDGGHFSAGLDLSEQVQREPQEVMRIRATGTR